MHIKSQLYQDYILESKREILGRTITETDFVVHAGQTGDFFLHHMDAKWCKKQRFKQHIAHGALTFSLGIGMTATKINPEAFSKGYDRLRFIKPVHIRDTIRVVVTICEKKEFKKLELGQVTEHVEIYNQRDELVLVCDHILLAKKKEFIN